jgi:hypothetical protein
MEDGGMHVTRYRLRTDELAWRVFDGEGVLVDLGCQRLFSCNASASVVVGALVGGAALADLVTLVCDAFEVEAARARVDVQALLSELEQAAVLAASGSEGRGSAPAAATSPAAVRRPYAPPVVESNGLFYVAAGCGKVSPRTSQCRRIPKAS